MSDSMKVMDALAVDIFYQEVDNWLNKLPSSIYALYFVLTVLKL